MAKKNTDSYNNEKKNSSNAELFEEWQRTS